MLSSTTSLTKSHISEQLIIFRFSVASEVDHTDFCTALLGENPFEQHTIGFSAQIGDLYY